MGSRSPRPWLEAEGPIRWRRRRRSPRFRRCRRRRRSVLGPRPALRRLAEDHAAVEAVVDAEVALVVVDDLGRTIAVEVEDARPGDPARGVLGDALPAVVQADAGARRAAGELRGVAAVAGLHAGRGRRRARRVALERRVTLDVREVVEAVRPRRARRRRRLEVEGDVGGLERRADLRVAIAVEVVDVRRPAVAAAQGGVEEQEAIRAAVDLQATVVDHDHLRVAVERVVRARARVDVRAPDVCDRAEPRRSGASVGFRSRPSQSTGISPRHHAISSGSVSVPVQSAWRIAPAGARGNR